MLTVYICLYSVVKMMRTVTQLQMCCEQWISGNQHSSIWGLVDWTGGLTMHSWSIIQCCSALLAQSCPTMPPFAECFQQHNYPCHIGFVTSAILSSDYHDVIEMWPCENIASKAEWIHTYNHIYHININIHIYIYIYRQFSISPQVWSSLMLT